MYYKAKDADHINPLLDAYTYNRKKTNRILNKTKNNG